MKVSDNFGFRHKCGVLAAVSSLPSDYGVGTFGAPCERFIDFLSSSGQKCWQILPLCPTAYGDSPYQSPSSFAINPYFADVEGLFLRGLLTKEELLSAKRDGEKTDYGFLFDTRVALLKKAYSRSKRGGGYYAFKKRNADWVEDYAYFMAIKEINSYRAWTDWDEEFKDYDRAKALFPELKPQADFWLWLQYELDAEWKKVRLYAHKRHISIIGDMPFYVAADSVDVWANKKNYLLSKDLTPTLVAGCPPDGFTPEGQLWGNPVYDWERLEKDGFSWWVARVKRSFKLYDILRIDHFRGFAGYYVVPYGEKTAVNGRWMPGAGKRLFAVIKKEVPRAKIIAEDLGFYTEDVGELLAFTGYPGMKLLQFAFFDDESPNLPRNFSTENCVVYTGSHDADCTYTWCKNLSGDALKRFKRECPVKKGGSKVYALIKTALLSIANLAVVPMQDYLELSNEVARMNTPSTAEGNWTWRIKSGALTKRLAKKMLAAATSAGRANNRKTGL